MIKSIAHICLAAKDLAAAEAFYCGLLGLKRQFWFKRGADIVGLYIKVTDHNFIEIFRADKADSLPGNVIKHLCLETDDIDAVRAKLIQNGVAAGEKKMGADNSWQFWIKGPDGIDIEFHQYTPESSQKTGKDCILK